MYQRHWVESAFSAALPTGTGNLVYRLHPRTKQQQGGILISNRRQVGLLVHRESSQGTDTERLPFSFPMGTEWQPAFLFSTPSWLSSRRNKPQLFLQLVLFMRHNVVQISTEDLTELRFFWEQRGGTNPTTTCGEDISSLRYHHEWGY